VRVRRSSPASRRGNILPLLALTVTLLFAFVALAIDVGVLTIARTEAQNACDAGALAGARVLNNRPGNIDNDKTDAETVARNTVLQNVNVFIQTDKKYTAAENMTFTDGSQAITVGQYNYNTTLQRFEPSFPSSSGGVSWTAVRVKLRGDNPTFFAKVVGVNSMPWETYAVAAHRPRDVAIILDFSASMMFGSLFHWETGFSGSTGPVYGSMTADPMYPQFGHYWRYTQYSTSTGLTSGNAGSSTASSRPNPLHTTAALSLGADGAAAPSNLTVETPGGPPMVLDYRFDPANVNDPSVPVATPNPANFRNAFNRWMTTTPAVENVFTDPSFRPAVTGSFDNGVYVNRTFNWSGYDALDRTSQHGPTPAPDSFKDQSDADATYAGDRWPRRGGQRFTTAVTWDPSKKEGTARDVRDLLSKSTTDAYTLIALGTRTTAPATLPGGYTFPASGDGGTSWDNFRDDLWEKYGYDLDLAKYSGTNPASTNRTAAALRTTDLFQGYSMGPGYYGKTFFVWPPDPRFDANANLASPSSTNPAYDSSNRPMHDWRRRFFYRTGYSESSVTTSSNGRFDPQIDNDTGTAGTQSINQVLLTNGTGRVLNSTATRYEVNYRAVLAWLKSGPQTLPPNLRAGRILYYSSIPNDVDSAGSNLDQRFWRDYIDFVLGFTGNDSGFDPQYALAGNEPKGFPEGTTPAVQATSASGSNPRPYMNYTDNPSRPRQHFWFGPLSMMAFISARSGSAGRQYWAAGTVHEAQNWQLKAAVNSALDDIKNNHPNDYCSLVYFSNYLFQTPRVPMGQDWQALKLSLFYPNFRPGQSQGDFISLLKGGDTTTEIRPYTSSMGNALAGNNPNANGGTDPVSGFAMAFNALSWSPSAQTARTPYGTVNGGTGRRGAAKIVIFETDGVPNGRPAWTYTNGGSADAYYREGGSNPGSSAADDAVQITKKMRLNAGSGGFSLPSAPCRVFAIGFGDLYSVTPEPAGATSGKAFLLDIQQEGGTSAVTDTALPAGHIISGPYQTRIDNLKDTLQRIMQSGVQVTLIQ
jgi:Flp pilus assembly protein TadG